MRYERDYAKFAEIKQMEIIFVFICRAVIISIIVMSIIVRLDLRALVTVVHVKMLTLVHLKVTEMFYAIAVQTLLVTTVPVSYRYFILPLNYNIQTSTAGTFIIIK